MPVIPEGPDTDDGVSDRLDEVMKQQKLMAVSHAESETEQQQKRQRAELADNRSRLLKAVKVEAPDLAAPLFEKLSALAYENHDFAPREVVDLLKAHKARFKDEPDYFDLGIAQREDLLDRIGFYRGVVIDQSLSNPVEAGFRDVLMKPGEQSEGEQRLQPAHLFYRKPNFSGYFENYYTASESVFQTQKNGVTNLSFSLGVAAGKFGNSAALGVALTKYGRQEESSGFAGKTVFTTANFYLPKIELSFDSTQPCASRVFCEACERAVDDPLNERTWQDKFQDLKRVLDAFGHFIPLQILVGGRLFATEKKLFEGTEKSSNFTDRFGVQVKASLSTVYADAEISGGYENSQQEAVKHKETREMQTLTFNAIGGEGTVVQDAAAWAESLYDYRRWACVQRENLIPSIDVLPEHLSQLCWDVLGKYAEGRSKQAILYEDKAYFLFYGKYGEQIGSRARDIFFSILNHAFDAAVTVKTIPPSEGEKAVLTKPETVTTQLWRMTENGQIILRATDRKITHGKSSDTFFALTAELPAEADNPLKDDYPVSLCQLSSDPAQLWDYPGSGELICRALGNDYVLDASSAKSLCLRKRSKASRLSHLWHLAEIPVYLESSLADQSGDVWVKIVAGKNGGVLSLSDAGCTGEPDVARTCNVVVQPDIGGEHQRWRKEDSGRLVSALGAGADTNAHDLILSADESSGRVLASPFMPDLAQKWIVDVEGKLSPKTGSLSEKFITCFEAKRGGERDYGSAVVLRGEDSTLQQKWIMQEYKSAEFEPKPYALNINRSVKEVCPIHYIDEAELLVEGRITGLEFFITRKSGWADEFALRMKITCGNDGEIKEIIPSSEINNDNLTPLFKESRKVHICQELLYLPELGVYSVRLDESNMSDSVRMLRLMYRLEKDGPWYSFANNTAPYEQSYLTSCSLDVALCRVQVKPAERIVAIGIDFDPRGQKISPKTLTGPVKT
ncbi:hypothetical protein SD961_15370 [Erwinia sp. MMLR14_017]|uniref:hypothetical protein n=1 Tax=Erwinia sp. MMLR14_017 TaxID=3093842 RepID=UPI00298FC7D6|nr:hypothetical protein [Erwinia sp. MMLR14_017]MDW8847254.1 hypothetical protein [Erwinia sp. MMLR14_017]